MMLHTNYYAIVEALEQVEQFHERGDVMLLFLPLAHNFARLTHLHGGAGRLHASRSAPTCSRIAEALAAVRPTTMPSVPRVYEKVTRRRRGAVRRGDRGQAADRRLGARGRPARVTRCARQGRALPPLLAVQHRLADRLVYSKVKERLGGRLRFGDLGRGAALASRSSSSSTRLDILILEGYGLTECTSGCSVNRPSRYRFGTVGPPLPGVEVRIADDGEILIRGDNVFAGYYKDPDATAEVLDDEGWLHTGDVGELDDDGFLRITDRKKDIIVTAGGKNVAPQNVENELKASKYVSQASSIGDRRPYVVALLTLDPAEVGEVGGRARAGADPADYPSSPEVRSSSRASSTRSTRDRSRVRADQAVRRPPARLLAGGGRGDADAQAPEPPDPGALRSGHRGALRGAARRLTEAPGRTSPIRPELGTSRRNRNIGFVPRP